MKCLISAHPNEIGHRAFNVYFNQLQSSRAKNALHELDAEVTKYVKPEFVRKKDEWLQYLPKEVGMEILTTIIKRSLDNGDEEFTKKIFDSFTWRLKNINVENTNTEFSDKIFCYKNLFSIDSSE